MDFADRLRRLDSRVLGPVRPVDPEGWRRWLARALVAVAVATVAPVATNKPYVFAGGGFLGLSLGIALRLPKGARRPAGRYFAVPLLVLALSCAFASVLLALSRPGDVSLREDCRRSSFSVYRDPLPEVRDNLSGLTVGKLCNDSAASRMHRAISLGTVAVLSAWTGLVLRRRATPEMPSGTPGA